MTNRELMQQALDALFNLRWAASERDKKNRIRQFDEFMDGSDEAIEALRARLAQPEQEIESDRDHVEDDGCPTEKAVLQRFWREHQKPEPVAQVHVAEDYHPHVIWAEGINAACFDQEYLYITPPQREWQGLTNEEIDKIEISASSILSAIYITEAQLKGKNA